jgi:hypothetical protein
MTEVMAADGTESLIAVTPGIEVAVGGAELAEAWTTGTVELEEEPVEGVVVELPLLLPPVEGPEEPDEAPSQRAGPGMEYESMGL